MNRSTRLFPVALLGVLIAVCLVSAPNLVKAGRLGKTLKEDTPSAIATKLMNGYRLSIKTGDFTFFDENMAQDFTYVPQKGPKRSKDEMLDAMRAALNSATIKSCDTKLLSAKKAQGGVVYLYDMKLVGVFETGQPKPPTIVINAREEALAKKTEDKWQITRIKGIKDTIKLNGKSLGGM